MSDEENIPMDDGSVEQQQETVPQEAAKVEQDQRARNDQEYNWAEIRRKNRELENKLRLQEEALQRLQVPQKEVEEDFGIEDDTLAEGKHVKDVKRENRKLQKEMQSLKSQFQEYKIKSKFSDIDQVLTPENIAEFNKYDPEEADSIACMSNVELQTNKAYKCVKKMLDEKNVQDANYQEKRQAEINAKKPGSIQSAPKPSAIGMANLLDRPFNEQMKKQLWDEMKQAARGG